MASEFGTMLETLAGTGIDYHINWQPACKQEQFFKKVLEESGFSVTPANFVAIVIYDIYYFYSVTEPHWTCFEDDPNDFQGHKGWGEKGMFTFSWNSLTGSVQYRTIKGVHSEVHVGIEALKAIYGPIPDFTPR